MDRELSPFAAEVKRLRLELELSQLDLARACGVPQPTIGKLESGSRSTVNAETLFKLARGLRKPVKYFERFFE